MVSYDQVKLADSVECERGNDKEAAVRQQWPGIFYHNKNMDMNWCPRAR